ncbi:MAG: type II toxin-antitoxin system HicA family toxin [Vicinamibacterales bacterium]
MAPKPRQLSGSDVIKALGRLGFDVVALRGSHAKVRRVTDDGQRQALLVPIHRELATGALLAIYRQARKFVAERDLRPVFFPSLH